MLAAHNREAQPCFRSRPCTGHGLKMAFGHMREARPSLSISGWKSQLIQPYFHCFQSINSSQDWFSHICGFLASPHSSGYSINPSSSKSNMSAVSHMSWASLSLICSSMVARLKFVKKIIRRNFKGQEKFELQCYI